MSCHSLPSSTTNSAFILDISALLLFAVPPPGNRSIVRICGCTHRRGQAHCSGIRSNFNCAYSGADGVAVPELMCLTALLIGSLQGPNPCKPAAARTFLATLAVGQSWFSHLHEASTKILRSSHCFSASKRNKQHAVVASKQGPAIWAPIASLAVKLCQSY